MEPLVALEDRPHHDIGAADRPGRSALRLVARSTDPQADLATRHRLGVTRLLAHRDDLRGVSAFADVIEESVRWSA